jgi:hypothetical protein
MAWLALFVGFSVGGVLGIIVMCLVVVGSVNSRTPAT